MRVGFIGLGIMGSRQAANLARAGHDLRVFNRTRETAEAWASEHKAKVADSPRAAAEGAEAVITMVVDGAQVEAMLLGEDGALAGAPAGTLFIDCSTIAPADARRLGEILRDQGHGFVDAPVTGSAPKAEDGTLTIMVGGEASDLERARPLFEAMGEQVIHMGPTGHGEMAKLINNTIGAINAAAVAEGLVLGRASGLDLDALLKVIGSGSGASAMLELKARPMLDHDFEPVFKLEHMLKDVRHCLAEGRALGVRPELAEAVEQVYAAADERGLGGSDFAAVVEVADAAKAP
jgi:3-hydroxyisobutyrate dehydrogenase-like beta-hydroxyacid dehydrogenase